jgi:hypothetical protein
MSPGKGGAAQRQFWCIVIILGLLLGAALYGLTAFIWTVT